MIKNSLVPLQPGHLDLPVTHMAGSRNFKDIFCVQVFKSNDVIDLSIFRSAELYDINTKRV